MIAKHYLGRRACQFGKGFKLRFWVPHCPDNNAVACHSAGAKNFRHSRGITWRIEYICRLRKRNFPREGVAGKWQIMRMKMARMK